MEYRLGDLYEVSNGLSKSGECFGSGYPFLNYSTVFNNYFIPDEIVELVQSSDKEQTSYSIKTGDVFITRTSETTEELGMSCVALKDYPKATFNGFCKRLRPITDKTYPLFMGYYFRTPQFRANFLKIASLITRASLRNEDLLKFKVNLPSVEIQKKIANMLYRYDTLILKNNKRIQLLEQMAENLYKEWFVRFRFPGYETVEFENGMPKGWMVEPISHNNKCFLGGTPSREVDDYWNEGTIPWINSGAINQFRICEESEFITSLALKKSATKLLPIRSTLVAITGATVGQVSLNEIEVCANQSVVGISNENGHASFTYFVIKQSINHIANFASGGAQQHINKEIIEKYKIISPSKALLDEFEKIVSPYFDEIRDVIFMNKNLKKQRDLLIPRLMSGKLEV